MFVIQLPNVILTYSKMPRKEDGKFLLLPFENSPYIGHSATILHFAQKLVLVFKIYYKKKYDYFVQRLLNSLLDRF